MGLNKAYATLCVFKVKIRQREIRHDVSTTHVFELFTESLIIVLFQ